MVSGVPGSAELDPDAIGNAIPAATGEPMIFLKS